jgi:hypothetical protein
MDYFNLLKIIKSPISKLETLCRKILWR